MLLSLDPEHRPAVKRRIKEPKSGVQKIGRVQLDFDDRGLCTPGQATLPPDCEQPHVGEQGANGLPDARKRQHAAEHSGLTFVHFCEGRQAQLLKRKAAYVCAFQAGRIQPKVVHLLARVSIPLVSVGESKFKRVWKIVLAW